MRTQQKLCLILKRNNVPSRVVRIVDEFSVGDRCHWKLQMNKVLPEIDRNNEATLLIGNIRFKVPGKCRWRRILFWIRWVRVSSACKIIKWAHENHICERQTVTGRGRMWVFGQKGAIYDKEWLQPENMHYWRRGGEGLHFLRTFVLKNTIRHVSGHKLETCLTTQGRRSRKRRLKY